MVRSETFRTHQAIGNPVVHVERMTQWDVDELIVLNIGAEGGFQHLRGDYKDPGPTSLQDFIERIGLECRIPLSYGGRLDSVEDAIKIIRFGADKIVINTAAHDDPGLIGRCAKALGSQAVVVSLDYRVIDGTPIAFVDRGRRSTGEHVITCATRAASLGAGEILLNSIERDGSARGYDLETIDSVASLIDIPVIACGGAGHQNHFLACFEKTQAMAAAAGNIFHFTENAYPRAKNFLRGRLQDIR